MDLKEILKNHGSTCEGIVVGVFYGNKETLTDKYDILRGINRGANHDVVDLTSKVKVFAGNAFWSWLSGGNEKAGEWVLEGILHSLAKTRIHEEAKKLLDGFQRSVVAKYGKALDDKGAPDWHKLLKLING